MRDADQMIADALRDLGAEAGLPGPVADAAWRAGRRRRLTAWAASAASIAAAIALALAVVLPLGAAPGPASAPSPLISITLSPATSASTGVLTAAAELLSQRAALLHLPSTRAQVLGPDVVLTGPAADQAQLKAIAMAGVLNFRQVLLYQPHSGTASAAATAYGDASLVNQHTLALFRELACTPDNTSTSTDQVWHTAGDLDNPDTQIVSCDSSGNKYALDVAKVQGTQIGNAIAELSTTSNQWAVLLTLNSAGATAFRNLTSELASKYLPSAATNQNDYWLDTIAVVLDGSVITAPEIEGATSGGNAQIAGNFTRAEAEELAAQLQSGALPVGFRVSAIGTVAPSASSQAAAGQPGQGLTADLEDAGTRRGSPSQAAAG